MSWGFNEMCMSKVFRKWMAHTVGSRQQAASTEHRGIDQSQCTGQVPSLSLICADKYRWRMT